MAASEVESILAVTRTLKDRLVETLGLKIVRGQIAPGEILQLESVALEESVSLSVVREAVGVLTSLGLVESRKKLGTVVQKSDCWKHASPEVIRWRLLDPEQRLQQLHWLVELRHALEPTASSLAAAHRSSEAASRLLEISCELSNFVKDDDMQGFLKADVEFHDRILHESANPLIASLSQHVNTILSVRHIFGLMPSKPDTQALNFHKILAQAIDQQDEELAFSSSSQIVEQATEEFMQAAEFSYGSPEDPPSFSPLNVSEQR